MICLKRDIRLLLKVCNSSVQKRHHKSRVKTGLFQLTWRRAVAVERGRPPSSLLSIILAGGSQPHITLLAVKLRADVTR